jgi:hypothetical protein
MGRVLRAEDVRRGGSTLRGAFVGIVAMGGALGCGYRGPSNKTEGLEDLQPVSGSVSFEGKPTPGAVVMFFRTDDPKTTGVRIAGVVDDEGVFEMTTGVAEGVLPGVKEGKYRVTVTWTRLADPDDKDSDLIDLLPEKYKDPNYSPLQAEVEAGENVLSPFELVP